MSADSCYSGSFQSCNTCTNDNYIFLFVCWFDEDSRFITVFCVKYTRDVTTTLNSVYTTFVTVETFTNWFVFFYF